jgi:hypothetical protein
MASEYLVSEQQISDPPVVGPSGEMTHTVIFHITSPESHVSAEWDGDVGTAVRTNFGCVGSARALGVQVALSRYTGPIDQCWLANTDADCEVPLIWLRDQLALAEAGHAAVAGIIAHRQIFYYRAPS